MDKHLDPDMPIHKERQVELDIAKGIAVLLMICVHVQEVLSHTIVQHSSPGMALEFLTAFPAAPTFMFAMGACLVYSKRQSARYAARRGLSLLLAAYLLNALRVFLPGLIGIKLGIFTKGSIPYGDLLLNLLDVDILHFAGLSFLFIGLLRRLRVPERAYPVIGLLLVGLNYLVRGISTGQIYIDSILGLFWGASETSYFPFLSWIMYPLAGAAFGHALKASDNKRVIYIKVVLAGGAALLLAMLASGFRFMYYMGFPEENMYAYFHEDLIGNAVNGSLALIWISFLFFVKGAFPKAAVDRLLFWSRELNHIYIIHWVIIGWSALFIGYNRLMYWQSALAMASVLFATDRIATFYAGQYKRFKEKPATITSA